MGKRQPTSPRLLGPFWILATSLAEQNFGDRAEGFATASKPKRALRVPSVTETRRTQPYHAGANSDIILEFPGEPVELVNEEDGDSGDSPLGD